MRVPAFYKSFVVCLKPDFVELKKFSIWGSATAIPWIPLERRTTSNDESGIELHCKQVSGFIIIAPWNLLSFGTWNAFVSFWRYHYREHTKHSYYLWSKRYSYFHLRNETKKILSITSTQQDSACMLQEFSQFCKCYKVSHWLGLPRCKNLWSFSL